MKLLILDDHSLFKDGLGHLLSSFDTSIELLKAATIDEAKRCLEEHFPISLMLIDLEMPDSSGFEVLDFFNKNHPTLPCVILSASTKRRDVEIALKKGAMGFISKTSTGSALFNAIKLILDGEIYVPYHLMHAERRNKDEARVAFTNRQLDVLKLVSEGHPNKIIASKLGLAEPTVKMHLNSVFEKLDVHNKVFVGGLGKF